MCIKCVIKQLGGDPDGNPDEELQKLGIQGGMVGAVGSMTALDLKDVLRQQIGGIPPPFRQYIVADLVATLCMSSISDLVSEEERTDEDAWEGKAPLDFFEGIVELLRETLPDAEGMVKVWNDFVVEQASTTLGSSERITFPDDWASGLSHEKEE